MAKLPYGQLVMGVKMFARKVFMVKIGSSPWRLVHSIVRHILRMDRLRLRDLKELLWVAQPGGGWR